MKIVEIVKIGRELLKMMSENDVKLEDWKYIKLYDEFKRMRANRVKYRVTISELAVSHNISMSKVERIIRRLGKDVK